MGRARDWFEGEGIESGPQVGADQQPSAPQEPVPAQEKPKKATRRAGWYLASGTLRYYDGEHWTDYVAPPHPPGLSTGRIAWAVFLGAFAAWAAILILANAEPETFFFPVKFVAEEVPDF